jgi:hypothetical protein
VQLPIRFMLILAFVYGSASFCLAQTESCVTINLKNGSQVTGAFVHAGEDSILYTDHKGKPQAISREEIKTFSLNPCASTAPRENSASPPSKSCVTLNMKNGDLQTATFVYAGTDSILVEIGNGKRQSLNRDEIENYTLTKPAADNTCPISFIKAEVSGTAPTEVTLKNEDVLEMHRAGFAPEIIVAKIKASETDFDTSITTIKGLKKEGVADSVIVSMVEAPKKERKNELPNKPLLTGQNIVRRTLRWTPGTAYSDNFIVQGHEVIVLTERGIAVYALMDQSFNKFAFLLRVDNYSGSRLLVDPNACSFELTQPKDLSVASLDPDRFARSLEKRGRWKSVLGLALAGLATRQSTIYASDSYGNSVTATITEPDYEARRNAQAAVLDRNAKNQRDADYVRTVSLKSNTLFNEHIITGWIYFERKNFEKGVLTCHFGDTIYELPFQRR